MLDDEDGEEDQEESSIAAEYRYDGEEDASPGSNMNQS